MNKIIALYQNEMIKISKKISLVVILALMICGVVGLAGLMKFQQSQQERYRNEQGHEPDWAAEEMKYQLDMFHEQEDSLTAQIDAMDPDADDDRLFGLEEELRYVRRQINQIELAMEYDVGLYDEQSFLNDVINLLPDLWAEEQRLQALPPELRPADWTEQVAVVQQEESAYREVLESRNFHDYIELVWQGLPRSGMTDAMILIEQERLDLWYTLDPSGGMSGDMDYNQVRMVLDQRVSLRRSMLERIDYTSSQGPVPMTPDRYAELENQLAVLDYRIENNVLSSSSYEQSFSDMAVSSMAGFGMFMVVMMMLILAGGAISQEMATGSIKSLIIAPVRRWKIFTAKVLSLVSVSLIATILLYLVMILTHGLMFGFSSGQPYIFASHGQAGALSFAIYQLASLLVRWISVLVFIALALMLSVVTRNTAAAVGISMAIFFGHQLIGSFLMFLPRSEWVKFIPFEHFSLLPRFFPFADSGGSFITGAMSQTPRTTLLFSLLYLLVLLICMGYTALDSFSRRDIK